MDAQIGISVLGFIKCSRCQGLHTHNNLQISEHCQCQTDYCKNVKTKTLPVFQIKDTKLDSGKSCSGKRITHWRKREQNKSTQEKPKREREQISEQEKIHDGSDSK